jgi:hypothetical protein
MSRMMGKLISPGRSASTSHGPTEIIWCTAGVSGMWAPASRAIFGLHTPQAMTTVSASIRPWFVSTARIRPSTTSRPVTSTLGTVVRAPRWTARSRMSVPARRLSTTPTVGNHAAPMMTSVSRNGTRSATSSGGTSSAGMPQAFALLIRRRSSSMRSSVRATS